MKTKNLIFVASLMLIGVTSFTSCQKDDETQPMVSISEQDDEADSYFDDVLAEVDDVTMTSDAKSTDMAKSTLEGQGTRVRTTGWDGDWRVDTITYNNYVNGNALTQRVKNGQIIIHVLGEPLQATFTRQVTFNNFTINGNLIEGEKTITKTSSYTYTISMQNGKITFTDGTTYTRTCERTRTWADGYDTPYNIWDDVYTIEGSATGVNRDGYAYTHQITNMLMKKMGCLWMVSGTIEMTVGDQTATFDYGSGDCDNKATVTVNGKSYEVRLRGGN